MLLDFVHFDEKFSARRPQSYATRISIITPAAHFVNRQIEQKIKAKKSRILCILTVDKWQMLCYTVFKIRDKEIPQ